MAKKHRSGEPADYARAKALDDLAEFEEFKQSILPALRLELTKGSSAEDIYKKFEAHAAARGITIAMTETDSGKALSAIKDILDRVGGKAKERSEVTHRLTNAPEEQLDALIRSKLEAVSDSDEEEVH